MPESTREPLSHSGAADELARRGTDEKRLFNINDISRPVPADDRRSSRRGVAFNIGI